MQNARHLQTIPCSSTIFDHLNVPAFISVKSFYPRHLIETCICSSRGIYFFILCAHLLTPRSRVRTSRRKHEGVVKDSVVKGHHIYKFVWTSVIGEELHLEPEESNKHDEYAVAVRKEGKPVGHVARSFTHVSCTRHLI